MLTRQQKTPLTKNMKTGKMEEEKNKDHCDNMRD